MRKSQNESHFEAESWESEMISDKLRQYGYPNMTPKGIVIHNTNINRSAKECEEMMSNATDSRGAHFFVDDQEVIQMMPLDWSCFNTGQGNDFGNTECISIEICSNLNTQKYMEAEQRAVTLIRELMDEFGLTTDDLYFHRDFDKTVNCPADILRIYKSKQNFIRRYFNEQ